MIAVLCRFKDEADIIESFIRCNSIYADRFVLMDNMSTDNSREILESLSAEGFAVDVIDDPEVDHSQDVRVTRLVQYTRETYDPDWYVLLDADEVLSPYSTDAQRGFVRSTIEALSPDQIHLVKWRVYVPVSTDDPDMICPYRRITHCRDESLETFSKVILPGTLVRRGSFSIAMGNHDAYFSFPVEHDDVSSLVISHYPCRSAAQMTAKFTNGWLNALSTPRNVEGMAFHWQQQFEYITENGNCPMEHITDTAKQFSVPHPPEPASIGLLYLPPPFAEGLELRYPIRPIPVRKLILRNSERLARSLRAYAVELGEFAQKFSALQSEYDSLSAKCTRETSRADAAECSAAEKAVRIEQLTQEKDLILNSISWRITSPLRGLKRCVKKVLRKQ